LSSSRTGRADQPIAHAGAVISTEPNHLAHRERMLRDAYAPFSDRGGATLAPQVASSRGGPLRVLWRQRVIIVACLALALLATGVYLYLATPMYRSHATMFVQPAGAVGQQLISRNDAARAPASGTVNAHREAEFLASTPVLATTLGDPSIQELQTFADVESRFDYLKDHLTVEVGSNDLITVSFLAPVSQDAAKVVDSVVKSYTTLRTKKNRTTTDELIETLTTERKQLQAMLDEKRAGLDEFTRKHGIIAGTKDGGGDIQVERMKTLAAALTTAQVEALGAKNTYEQAQRSIADDPEKLRAVREIQTARGMTPVTPEDEAMLRQEISQTQSKLQDMRQRYLPNHQIIRRLERRMSELSVAYVAAMERRYQAAQNREADLKKAFEAQQKLATERSADLVQYTRLDQDLQAIQQRIAANDEQIHVAQLSDAGSSAVDVQLMDQPRMAEHPAVPDSKTVIPWGLGAGLLVGLCLAVVRDRLDPRLHSAEEVKAVLGIPILGTLPRMPENLAPAVRGQRVLLEPGSDVAEAYRALRTAINFGVPEGRARTILIASPSAGDGKTTVASNLAIGLAQGGKRVVLLDADLRQPGQHDTFGVENHAGLVDILAHEVAPAEVAQKTLVQNLELIPAGPSPENPADLLNSPRFVELMDELADRYDHVVIDSPPVLAVTDARVIAASTDITVLVLRADCAERRQSEAARDGLVGVGANLLGLVMNFAAPGSQGYPAADSAYRASNGSASRSATRSSTTFDPLDEHADDATPLVALDAMKSLEKRPNQLSKK
jgi:capsular exopolysaccharide synthesis family protein